MLEDRFEREISLEGALTDVSDAEEPTSPQSARKLKKRTSSRDVQTDIAFKSMYRGCTEGCLMAAVAYMSAQLVTQSHDKSEDLVHLCHSLYTASVSVAAVTTLQYGGAEHHGENRSPLRSNGFQKQAWVFAPWAECRAVQMYRRSLGYLFADMASVLLSFLSGKRPGLWAGRLVRGLLQSAANVICMLPGQGSRARCCYLGMGYLMEVSLVPLWLLSFVKESNSSDPLVMRSLHLATSVSLVIFRNGGGIASLYLIWKARHCVERQTNKANFFLYALACVLNTVGSAMWIRGRHRK
mmetsp:Transcript_103354/g.188478  ORF Transcript_103354/g.188478 Transcript_103354/m.188478 type:complete len:297 (+) Transcript_103354:77-967(+)